ncbi:LacI family DNA-binding transcriptional regulator [Kineococcus radiotolerans]|uniref:Regulatory protein LacI n=1 Tax=Kineococcus radiotolerans (strain ATCC BAA-149 / DSM 14245 / SRS30216) TaxID=266940 RepID=A6WB15_KINRD|nr:LacI family DNA-binding transcriptional regulator [Kineococcus radiotolerans]ABS04004.1 regulatory protein LacI [Kineococcus radiotolerans SRS30216 = ATCC BAA-149]
MATSADVAQHAGLSRSTVSQILNGREHLFSEETIARVRASAAVLGYRPSLAGRTLARGTSDIVITLIPDVTFNPRLRELVDIITADLTAAGLTNLLRFVGSEESLHDTLLGLKPFGVVSLAPLPPAQERRIREHGVHLIAQPREAQVAIDEEIGRLQARYLTDAGYDTLAVVVPVAVRERGFALPRERGAKAWCSEQGVRVLPTLRVALERGGAQAAVAKLPPRPVGLVAYNDEVALAVLGAALHQGRRTPEDFGLIGVDNSSIARASTPSITTVDYDIAFSGHAIAGLLLQRLNVQDVADPAHQVTDRLRVVAGDTTPAPTS